MFASILLSPVHCGSHLSANVRICYVFQWHYSSIWFAAIRDEPPNLLQRCCKNRRPIVPSKTLSKTVLTRHAVDALLPETDAYLVPDIRCPGLSIRVAPSGRKTWDFVARVRGTSIVKRKALGAFPAIGLDDARLRGTAIGRAAQAGRDLIDEEVRAKEVADARITVKAILAEYLKRRAKKLRTYREIETRLTRALAPIAHRTADELRRRDLSKLLNATADRGVEREAEKQRQSISAMFNWAISEDLIDNNPTVGLKSFSTGTPRERVLTPDEIYDLWNWIGASDLTADMSDSLKLQLCFGCRIGEASGINAEEIDQANGIWTLPAARSKNKKARRTPIVGLAREILDRRLQKAHKGPLFVNETRMALRSNDIASAIITRRKRIPLNHFVSHDLRRTVATQLVELGISFELTAAVLGHETGNANVRILSRHYIRSDFLERKRVALEAWDSRLRSIIAGDTKPLNVIQLSDLRHIA
jgi:integrase